MKMRVFQYAILLHPIEDKDNKTSDKTLMLNDPEFILAVDDKQAAMLVARQIPEDYLDALNRIEVLVRPF